MFSYEAASTSLEALHHGDTPLTEWHGLEQIQSRFQEAANEALFATAELLVTAEHSIESIAEHFGILPFGHHISNKKLEGCKLILTTNHHLEIHRPDAVNVTRFPITHRVTEEQYRFAS